MGMTLLTLSLAIQASGIPVEVLGPPAGTATCIVRHEPSATSRPLESSRWACGRDEVLQCSADGFEPRDIPATACGTERLAVRMTRGSSAQLMIHGDARVEWRSVGGDGTTLLATRLLSGTSTVMLAEPRVLRVYRSALAPMSFVVSAGDRVSIPTTAAGGEIFGRVAGDDVRPERVHFSGPSEARVDVSRHGYFASPALAPGTYTVVAEYRGGIRSEAVRVDVAGGRTTEEYRAGIPGAAGITVTADPSVCLSGHTLLVGDAPESAFSSFMNIAVRRRLPDAGCAFTFDGLKPGHYRLAVHGPSMTVLGHDDLRAAEQHHLASGRRIVTRLTRPTTKVTGTVTAGGRPLTNVRLRLSPAGSATTATYDAVTDQNGRYTMMVDRAGRYLLSHQPTPLIPGVTAPVIIADGETRFDWPLPPTRLSIALAPVSGSSARRTVMLRVHGPQGLTLGGTLPLAKTTGTITFIGIPTGEYTADAFSNTLVSSAPLSVSLTEARPEAQAALRLESSVPVTLRVTGPDGTVLSSARVRGGQRSSEAGMFDVGRQPPGAHLIVSARGFIPRCVVLQRAHRPGFEIALQPASLHTVSLRFTPGLAARMTLPGLVHDLPGSDCPVPLSAFTETVRRTDRDSTVVTVRDLPAGAVTYAPTPRYPARPLEVPGPELAFVLRSRQPTP